MNGLLLVHKEEGFTSQDVCNVLKKKLHTKKIGHCGTLDPFATGLMIVGINEGTKILSYLEGQRKTYNATLKLGVGTDSYDKTGKIIEETKVPILNKDQIDFIFNQFIGQQEQYPPMYSAIKINGKKLYEYARKNIEITRQARSIFISNLKCLFFNEDTIQFQVTCSRGTYVRTLGVDIAKKLNTSGHLIQLEREKIGKYQLNQALKLNQIDESTNLLSIAELFPYTTKIVDEKQYKDIKDGKKINFESEEKIILFLNQQQQALAIYELDEKNIYRCVRGFYYGNH